MQKTYLVESEELILLTAAILHGETYGVSVAKDLNLLADCPIELTGCRNGSFQIIKGRSAGVLREMFEEQEAESGVSQA